MAHLELSLLGVVALGLTCAPIAMDPPVLPISVSYEGLRPEQVSSLKFATVAWNELLGQRIFVLKPQNGKVKAISTGDPAEISENTLGIYLGDPWISGIGKGSTWTGELYVRQDLEPGPELGAVFCHELGHALGLDHLQDFESVMYPKINEEFRPIPTEEDAISARSALARFFAPK